MSVAGATRVYVSQTIAPGAAIELAPGPAHHLRTVLRLGAGAAVAAFNASDGEWLCHISQDGRDGMVLTAGRLIRPPQPDPDLWLLFAPIKRLRLDWLIEKGTELGVGAFIPVMTERTQPERLNRERLAAHAVAATEQSERLSVPDIRALAPLARVIAEWPAARPLILCDETGSGPPIAEILARLPAGTPAALLVGPEGGFAQTELDALANLPFVTRAGLGPRVPAGPAGVGQPAGHRPGRLARPGHQLPVTIQDPSSGSECG